MNNTFNINRFGLLLKRQWLDFGKIYLISLVVVLGALVTFYIFNIPNPEKSYDQVRGGFMGMNFRIPLFFIVGFIFISIVASSYFATLGQKSRAILELMTPSSTFEKFLCGVFYTAVLSILSYLIIFHLTDLAFTKYVESSFNAVKSTSKEPFLARTLLTEVSPSLNVFGYFFAVPFMITSIFLLGSIYFNRFHYIKTAISVMIFTGAATYIVYKTASFLTRDMVNVNHGSHQNKEDLAFLLILLVTTALTLIFWAIAYVRLKEKEV